LFVSDVEIAGIGIAAICILGIYVWWMREIPVSIDSKLWKGQIFTGRPDAVIKKGPWHIPIEYKSSNYDEPMESHRLQLLCYCFLLEEAGFKVPYGLLQYRGKKFKIRWNKRTKGYLMQIADEALDVLSKDFPPPPLEEGDGRCYKCAYRFICKQQD
jgi:CRISPR-associated exonuclease Cas4